MNDLNELRYNIYGVFPVKFVPTQDGGLAVLKLDTQTGLFEHAPDYLHRILYARDDVERVDEHEFIQQTEALRARNLTGDGPVFALYQLMNSIEDVAEQEGRSTTDEERALIAELRRESHALFQALHPDPE